MSSYDRLDSSCPYCGHEDLADNEQRRPGERLWQRCRHCGATWEPPADLLDDPPLRALGSPDELAADLADELDDVARDVSWRWLQDHRPALYDQDNGADLWRHFIAECTRLRQRAQQRGDVALVACYDETSAVLRDRLAGRIDAAEFYRRVLAVRARAARLPS